MLSTDMIGAILGLEPFYTFQAAAIQRNNTDYLNPPVLIRTGRTTYMLCRAMQALSTGKRVVLRVFNNTHGLSLWNTIHSFLDRLDLRLFETNIMTRTSMTPVSDIGWSGAEVFTDHLVTDADSLLGEVNKPTPLGLEKEDQETWEVIRDALIDLGLEDAAYPVATRYSKAGDKKVPAYAVLSLPLKAMLLLITQARKSSHG